MNDDDLRPTELGGDERQERPRRGELHGADDPWGWYDATRRPKVPRKTER